MREMYCLAIMSPDQDIVGWVGPNADFTSAALSIREPQLVVYFGSLHSAEAARKAIHANKVMMPGTIRIVTLNMLRVDAPAPVHIENVCTAPPPIAYSIARMNSDGSVKNYISHPWEPWERRSKKTGLVTRARVWSTKVKAQTYKNKHLSDKCFVVLSPV
jgi:hypothetical protein